MKIVFYNSFMGLPIPSTMGGGAEELLTILLNENEKADSPDEFYFVQKYCYGKEKKYMMPNNLQNSKLVYVRYNRFFNFFQRVVNKCLKILKIKKNYPTVFPTDYHNQALKEIKKIDPDIIIFEGQVDANIPKYQKRFGKSKLYLHLHIQDLEKVAMDQNVAGIISVSNFINKDYESFVNKPMNNYVLLNSVDEDRFNKSITQNERTEIRKKFGFNADDFVVVFCGRIASEKGVKELCGAILASQPSVKLLIVGGVSSAKKQTSSYQREIQRISSSSNNRIRFTGYINNKDLYKIYQSADIQTIPSLWEEAAGLVVIEGQLSGLPQIMTRSGGMQEYANQNGSIVLDKDQQVVQGLVAAIKILKENPQLLRKMGKSNKEYAKQFTKHNYYVNFKRIITDIARRKC